MDDERDIDSTHALVVDPWKKHEFLDGLYRFYLEKIIGFHAFYLPLVGGVVAYVLAHPSPAASLGLIVPLIVSIGAAFIFKAGIREAAELNDAIGLSAAAVQITKTHAQMLVRAARAFFCLHVIISVGLVLAGGSMAYFGYVPGFAPSAASKDVAR